MSEWAEPCYEPLLAEILAEPIIRALMVCDRVEHSEIVALLLRIATKMAEVTLAAA